MIRILIVSLFAFFLVACANNGGPFDKSFWVGKTKDTVEVVVDTAEEVVEEVTEPDPEKCKKKKKCK